MNLEYRFKQIDKNIYNISRPLCLKNSQSVNADGGEAVELFKIRAHAAVRWGMVQATVEVSGNCAAEILFYNSAGQICSRSGKFNITQGENNCMSLFYYRGSDEVTVKVWADNAFMIGEGRALAVISGARA